MTYNVAPPTLKRETFWGRNKHHTVNLAKVVACGKTLHKKCIFRPPSFFLMADLNSQKGRTWTLSHPLCPLPSPASCRLCTVRQAVNTMTSSGLDNQNLNESVRRDSFSTFFCNPFGKCLFGGVGCSLAVKLNWLQRCWHLKKNIFCGPAHWTLNEASQCSHISSESHKVRPHGAMVVIKQQSIDQITFQGNLKKPTESQEWTTSGILQRCLWCPKKRVRKRSKTVPYNT